MTKKKLTIADLIDAKEKFLEKKKKTKDVYVEELDAVVTIQRPTRELALEAMDMGGAEADAFIIYNCVVSPDLTDKELQKAFGCVEPTDIVGEIFDMGTIYGLASTALDMLGKNSKVEIVDDLKN